MEDIYTVFDKKERVFFSTIDLSKAASLLNICQNTLRNRLKRGTFEDNNYIIGKSILYRSIRGKK